MGRLYQMVYMHIAAHTRMYCKNGGSYCVSLDDDNVSGEYWGSFLFTHVVASISGGFKEEIEELSAPRW